MHLLYYPRLRLPCILHAPVVIVACSTSFVDVVRAACKVSRSGFSWLGAYLELDNLRGVLKACAD